MQYPLFPFKEIKDRLSQYIVDLKDDQNFKFIHGLKATSSEIEFIEASTREQANDPSWFKHKNINLQPLFVIKLAIPHQKHLKG